MVDVDLTEVYKNINPLDIYHLRWMIIKRELSEIILKSYPELNINKIEAHVNASMDLLYRGIFTDSVYSLFGMLPGDFTFVYSIKEQAGECSDTINDDMHFFEKYSIIRPLS